VKKYVVLSLDVEDLRHLDYFSSMGINYKIKQRYWEATLHTRKTYINSYKISTREIVNILKELNG